MGARVRIAILAAVTTGAISVLPAGAGATPVTCGATITSDATLEADLDCGFLDSISIGADRVTLDLNGHLLLAIVRVEGRKRVTIRDGALGQLHLRDAHRNRVLGISSGSGDSSFTLTDSSRNLIEGSSLGHRDGPGLGLIRSDRNTIRGNVLGAAFGGGLFLDQGSDRNKVSDNRVSGSQAPALDVHGSRNRIVGNRVSSCCSAGGVFVTGALRIFGGRHNVVAFNDVMSDTDGILIEAAASRTIVARNAANGSGDDGIDVESARTTLWRNKANRNGDLGIEAVPGVRDAGGNRAMGNGNPLQCLNVACSPGAAATVFTGSAADPANDLAPFIGDPLPEPPVDFTNVRVRYDAVAGRVDVSYRFSRAPASYQDVHAGVGLGTVQPDGSCSAPVFTDLSWRPESDLRGEAYVEGHSTGFAGSVIGSVFDDMGGASLGTASFEWSASRRTWDFATIHPSLVGRHYTCVHAGVWLTGGPPGSNTGPGVDYLDSDTFALSPVSP